MAVLKITSFGGIAPKVPPRYLKDSAAQVAVNCPMWNGSLTPIRDLGSTVHTVTKSGTPKTIYRFGQDTVSDSSYWFHWTTDVDVCRSQIAGDTSEWTFFTGDGVPKATYSTIALSGTDLPTATRPLGLPAPSQAVSATAVGAVDAAELAETRVYTYTFVNKESGREIESAPATASDSVTVRTSQSVALSGFVSAPTGGYVVTHRRIYRSTSGTYLLVAEIPINSTTYSDSVAPESLAEEIPSMLWSDPPSGLEGLINLPNGMMAGFVGRDIYFCDPYHPHAWPENYIQTLDYPIVGLGRMDTTLAVLTTGVPYLAQGTHPTAVALVKSDLQQACVSKRSIVSHGGSVFYAAPDGLMRLSPGGSEIVTRALFDRTQWQYFFKPESIHAYAHDNQYIAFYDNDTVQGGFIYDMTSGNIITHDIYVGAAFHDIQRDKLFLVGSDRKVKVWNSGDLKTYIWRSKVFTMPKPVSFGWAQVEAEGYSMTAKFYVDGSLAHTRTVASRDPFRLPVAVGRDWEVQVEGTKEVFSVALAHSAAELRNG